jgi:molecular chaperone DnaK (HSP70)
VADKTKRDLTSATSVHLALEYLHAELDLECIVPRSRLQQLCAPVIERVKALCARALSDAGVSRNAILDVVMGGGCARIPCVREAVSEYFGRPIVGGIEPDEAAVSGALQRVTV